MMKITVLDRESIGLDTPLGGLDAFGFVEVFDRTAPEDIVERISDSDVIIINKVKITREVIESSPKLRLICIFATGYDDIDVRAARERGVAVCNVPGYSTSSVTAMTVATVLALSTHLFNFSGYVKSGKYTASGLPNRLTPVFHDLSGKVWGIIGCGDIGGSVAAVATALGARVITYQRHRHSVYDTVSLEELCRTSDIITVHCPLNDESRGMINTGTVSLMKNGVILVNCARGAVFNEGDVAEAVINGKIGGLGCDVYSNEPFSHEHPYTRLLDFDNVIFTPHCAWASYEARVKCIGIICDNINSFFNNKILNRVDI